MNEVIHVAGWTLVRFVWQGAVVGAAAAIALGAARRTSAATRYAIACAALIMMVAAPAFTAWSLLSPDGRIAALDSRPASGPLTVLAPSLFGSSLDVRAASVGTRHASFSGRAVSWFPWLVGLWLTGVTALTARTAFGWRRARRLHRTALTAPSSRWQSAAARLATVLGIRRRVHVTECDLVDSPAVVGWLRPVIVMPVAALANLTTAQVDAILAHELAHIRRHDYLVNLAQTLAETLLFYHPAVWWLSNRLRVEREHCCDDVALGVCGDAIEYAEALAEIEARRAVPALALGANAGPLVHRIRRILGAAPPAPSLTGWVVAPVLAGVLTVGAVASPQVRPAAPAAPRPPAPPSAPAAPAAPAPVERESDVSVGREFRMQSNDWMRKLDVRGRGAMTFSDDLTDITTMADGAYLTIRDRNWFTVRSIELRGDRGAVTRRFNVSGVEQPWDPEGRQWLADRLPSLVRRAGLAAESRIRQILSTNGVGGALDEINLLESDYVRRLYYRELFRAASIDGATAARVLASAGDNIRSDFELRRTLEAAVPFVAADTTAVQAYVDAIASISSDFEHRQALDALVETEGLNGAAIALLAQSAARIGSDFEKRQALSRLIRRGLNEPEGRKAVLGAAATIESDYECATLLSAFIEAHGVDGTSASPFFDAVGTLGSDFERGRVLKALGRRGPLAPDVLQGLFAAVGDMQSDFEQAEVLLSVLRAHPIDPAARPAFIAAADTIHSDYEQTRVLAALVRAERR